MDDDLKLDVGNVVGVSTMVMSSSLSPSLFLGRNNEEEGERKEKRRGGIR